MPPKKILNSFKISDVRIFKSSPIYRETVFLRPLTLSGWKVLRFGDESQNRTPNFDRTASFRRVCVQCGEVRGFWERPLCVHGEGRVQDCERKYLEIESPNAFTIYN